MLPKTSAPTSHFAAVMAAVRRQLPGLVGLSCLVNLLLLVTAIYSMRPASPTLRIF